MVPRLRPSLARKSAAQSAGTPRLAVQWHSSPQGPEQGKSGNEQQRSEVERAAPSAAGTLARANRNRARHGYRSVTGAIHDGVRNGVRADHRSIDGVVCLDFGGEVAVDRVRRGRPGISVRRLNRQRDRRLAAQLNSRRARVASPEITGAVVVEHVETRSADDRDVDAIIDAELRSGGIAGACARELLRSQRELADAVVHEDLVASGRVDADDVDIAVSVRVGRNDIGRR